MGGECPLWRNSKQRLGDQSGMLSEGPMLVNTGLMTAEAVSVLTLSSVTLYGRCQWARSAG